mmetsp:Transcript_39941/g.112900  ORF Transcript_39941/g.112900 Transcript_39941/m.112900 type:complete len:231 (-) Transcript_39941:1424-2116(-)
MNFMNSGIVTSPEQSASSAFQTARSSRSGKCSAEIARQGRRRRTISRISSKCILPESSESIRRNTLYQLPPAPCHLSAASLSLSTVWLRANSSASGHVSSSSWYSRRNHSSGVTSPEPSASTSAQSASRSSCVTPFITRLPSAASLLRRSFSRSAPLSSKNPRRLFPSASAAAKRRLQDPSMLEWTPWVLQYRDRASSSARAVAWSSLRLRSGGVPGRSFCASSPRFSSE